MIFSRKVRSYFEFLNAKVVQGMAKYQQRIPYFIKGDDVIRDYECIREVWSDSNAIKNVCEQYKISRSCFYEMEDRFVHFGLPGLFPILKIENQKNQDIEKLVVMIKKSTPKISHTAILRIVQAVPLTGANASLRLISDILESHGMGISGMNTDREFWGGLQRRTEELGRLLQSPQRGRRKRSRLNSFFVDGDPYHKRLELLRTLFFSKKKKVAETCVEFGISLPTYYRLIGDYRLYGPWSVFSAYLPGKETLSDETQLKIILEKLRCPGLSPSSVAKALNLRCSRFAVGRIIKRWKLEDTGRAPVALDQYLGKEFVSDKEDFKAIQSATQLLSDEDILSTRRINRHFEQICQKMKTHAFHICDPGPLLLAPFVNELGIVQAFETYGPERLRGKEISNLALLNVFRILAGYRHISHLSNDRDRSVILASGIGLFGSSSKFYDDSLEFNFENLHHLRCDLVARAKELGIIEGMKIAYDFHFKEFYGSHAKEKGIGKGPAKSGDIVPGFRPHIAWDLATNVIMNIAYYQGAIRSPRILRQFCEQNIFPIFNPLAIEEIYMDSEYTKEGDIQYFKEITCKNGDVYICLRQNKQIKKFIEPALSQEDGWMSYTGEDEGKQIHVVLPKTKLPLTIAILRGRKEKDNIRCFGTTASNISLKDLLRKYRYRWIIENGIKDLVKSYFLDEMYGMDPQKVEFEFYCIMVARLAYEYFLKELGGEFLNKEDGNKYTLHTMRKMLLEKRNCTIIQNASGNLVLTFLDAGSLDVEKRVSGLFHRWTEKGKNRVLWWNNRGIDVRFKSMYDFQKVSAGAG